MRIFVSLAAVLALALPAEAVANPVEGHYSGRTDPGKYRIEFRYSSGAVHDFKFEGHVLVSHMSVVRDHFEGHYSRPSRLIVGAFRSDGEAVGYITTSDGQTPQYVWHVKPGHYW